jgi:hypothetical protein
MPHILSSCQFPWSNNTQKSWCPLTTS